MVNRTMQILRKKIHLFSLNLLTTCKLKLTTISFKIDILKSNVLSDFDSTDSI